MTENQIDLYDIRLQEAKKQYFDISRLICPCLDNQYVNFNQQGFRHLLRKGKTIRPINDQLRRFALLKFIETVICSNKTEILNVREGRTSCLYAIALRIDSGQNIRIIIMKNIEGKYYFISIMNQ